MFEYHPSVLPLKQYIEKIDKLFALNETQFLNEEKEIHKLNSKQANKLNCFLFVCVCLFPSTVNTSPD